MRTKQISGIVGSALLVIGVFLPIFKVPLLGTINYVANGRGDGVILLVLGVVSIILSFTEKYRFLWATGVAGGCVAGFTIYKFQSGMSELAASMPRAYGAMPAMVQMQWGWGVIILGLLLIFAAAAQAQLPAVGISLPAAWLPMPRIGEWLDRNIPSAGKLFSYAMGHKRLSLGVLILLVGLFGMSATSKLRAVRVFKAAQFGGVPAGEIFARLGDKVRSGGGVLDVRYFLFDESSGRYGQGGSFYAIVVAINEGTDSSVYMVPFLMNRDSGGILSNDGNCYLSSPEIMAYHKKVNKTLICEKGEFLVGLGRRVQQGL